MLHKRRIKPNTIARALSFSKLSIDKVCSDHDISGAELQILLCCHTLQLETNKFITPSALRARCGYSGPVVATAIRVLVGKSYMVSGRGRGRYNVTVSGGYVVRSLVTEITRCLNDTVFSLWTNAATKDPALAEYFEPSAISRHKRVGTRKHKKKK